MPKTRITREFQDEAVRLVLTSGRSQRAIADDLGVNRSTLARWMAEHEDRRPSSAMAPNEDIVDELKRLRRENEVLRQERDILKKPTAFSSRREVDEVHVHRCGESGIPHPAPVPGS